MGPSKELAAPDVVVSDTEESCAKLKHDETSLMPWLCVLGSSLYLMTSFGKSCT